jgi:hypothetical protein
MDEVDVAAWTEAMEDIRAMESWVFIRNVQTLFTPAADGCIEQLAIQGFTGKVSAETLRSLKLSSRYPRGVPAGAEVQAGDL